MSKITTTCASTTYRAHKVKLYPNNRQKTMFEKHVGVARLTYNWCLDKWNTEYEASNKPSRFGITNLWNSQKKQNFPFVYEVSTHCQDSVIKDLADGFNRFFKKQANHPKFRRILWTVSYAEHLLCFPSPPYSTVLHRIVP